MPVSEATLLAKISALEKRVTQLAAKVRADETALQAVLGMSSAQLSALATITASQFTTLGTTNIAFLASLRQTAHLNNDNSTTDTWDNAGRALWNQLKAAMVDTNIMA